MTTIHAAVKRRRAAGARATRGSVEHSFLLLYTARNMLLPCAGASGQATAAGNACQLPSALRQPLRTREMHDRLDAGNGRMHRVPMHAPKRGSVLLVVLFCDAYQPLGLASSGLPTHEALAVPCTLVALYIGLGVHLRLPTSDTRACLLL